MPCIPGIHSLENVHIKHYYEIIILMAQHKNAITTMPKHWIYSYGSLTISQRCVHATSPYLLLKGTFQYHVEYTYCSPTKYVMQVSSNSNRNLTTKPLGIPLATHKPHYDIITSMIRVNARDGEVPKGQKFQWNITNDLNPLKTIHRRMDLVTGKTYLIIKM